MTKQNTKHTLEKSKHADNPFFVLENITFQAIRNVFYFREHLS